MATKLQVVAISITKTKNNDYFMVNTAKGAFSVKKEFLTKRAINVDNILAGNPHTFAVPTVVVIDRMAKGDYLFPDNNGVAPQDSTSLDENGVPAYKAGDKPTWSEPRDIVRSFVGFQEFKAQLEMEKLMKELEA